MSVFIFLKTILDIRNIGKLFLEFFAFLKKNRLLPIVYSLPIICFLFFLLLKLQSNDVEFPQEVKRSEMTGDVTEYLRDKCGDKTAISISVISTEKNRTHKVITDTADASSAKWRQGIFFIAQACDDRQKTSGKDCIIDLKDHNTAYREVYNIDDLTYKYLITLTGLSQPSHIKLNKNGVQDLENLRFLPTIKSLVEMTDWAKEGIVKDLWITATANIPKLPNGEADVLYVFTFKTAKNQTGCDSEIHEILIKLKNKMGIPKWLY